MIQRCVHSPVPVLAMVCILLLTDSSGMIRLSLLASVVHELGHCVVYCLQTGKLPRLQLGLCGIGLSAQQLHQSRLRQTFLLLAGPAANLAACSVLWYLIEQRATYARYFFLAANLICAVYNLLPIGMLDGARLLRLWVPLRFEALIRMLECTVFLLLAAGLAYNLFGRMPLWAGIAFCIVFSVSLWQSAAQR